LTGGGTGGHYYPSLAIGEAIQKAMNTWHPDRHAECYYIGSAFGIEARREDRNIFKYRYFLPVKGFARSFYKGSIQNNLKFPFRLIQSVLQVKKIFRTLKPDIVIATGGYVAGVPGREAIKRKIPLYLQEQNAWPGITTRILAKQARVIFYAYPEVMSHLSVKPGTQYVFAPNPVRKTLRLDEKDKALKQWKLDPERKTLFIFGGSQGARSINKEVLKYVRDWVWELPLQIIWQTGDSNFDQVKADLNESPHIHLYPFIEDMGSAYSAADLVLCRAGALTLAELKQVKKPAILIPLPSAAANHQYHNAVTFEREGIAKVITEEKFKDNAMNSLIRELITKPELLDDMKNHYPEKIKNGLDIIVQTIIKDLPF
jgi:UDP-N-acetylglucosamine--N-acetylmuramyl-(pentapeptide) pyrophosphoryl-undecaprenol N-acetylglucosamine transferase